MDLATLLLGAVGALPAGDQHARLPALHAFTLPTCEKQKSPVALMCIYPTMSEDESLFLCLTELYITFPGKLSYLLCNFLPQGLVLDFLIHWSSALVDRSDSCLKSLRNKIIQGAHTQHRRGWACV